MRKLMWFSLGFCAACLLGVVVCPGKLNYLCLLPAAGVLSVALLVGGTHFSFLKRPAAVAFGIAIGLCWFSFYDGVYLDASRQIDGKIVDASIVLADYSVPSDYGGSSARGKLDIDGKNYQVVVYLNDTENRKPGDRIDGRFRFRFTAEGGRDAPTYHRSEGVYLLAYASGRVITDPCSQIPFSCAPAMIRKSIEEHIDRSFPRDAAAFAKALLLGNREDLAYETATSIRVSGLSHIVAVSGLHVSILFALLYLVTGRKRLFLLILGIPVLVLFSAVTGFTPSVVRACIMQALVLIALAVDKEYDPPTALSLAGLVMLAVNPMVILSISFQLTMACMVGILLLSQPIRSWLTSRRIFADLKGKGLRKRGMRWVVNAICVSVSATVFTTPFVAYHFGTVSLLSVVSNLLLVWLVSWIFYGVMLVCALGWISTTLAAGVGWVITWLIRLFLLGAELIARIPFAAVYTKSIYIVFWLVAVYILLAVFLFQKKKRPVVFGAVCTICLCAALLASWAEPLLDPCRVTVLDVGQGQSILLQSQGKSFLVDCGGEGPDYCADTAAETLLSQGISRLDGLIVTHYDADHVGGAADLLSRVPADRVYLPDFVHGGKYKEALEAAAGDRAHLVQRDLVLTFDQGKLTIFAPESNEMENECSICVLFQTEDCDILITGDRGALGEKLLMHRTELPKLDVLIAGHHGSNDSTGVELLAQTRPEYVFASVGEGNRYGHPGNKLIDRLQTFSCRFYRTDRHGTIIFRG